MNNEYVKNVHSDEVSSMSCEMSKERLTSDQFQNNDPTRTDKKYPEKRALSRLLERERHMTSRLAIIG